MVRKIKFPRIFFGWGTVVVGSFMNFWGSAFLYYGFSALFKPMSSELGFTRAATSVASGISRLEGGVLSPVVGWVVDRFGPRWPAFVGIFVLGLGLASMYLVNSLWTFYLVWGVIIGVGHSFGETTALDKAISNWFVKKRGLALGIRMAISGVLILPAITWSISTHGWRLTYLVAGLVMAVVGLPLVALFIRQHRPEYYGLLPDGATVKEDDNPETAGMIERGIKYAAEVEEIEFTPKQALKTPVFWLILVVAQGGYMTAHSPVTVHQIPMLTDMGMTPAKAATTVLIAAVLGLVARFLGGVFGDRLRKGQLRFLYGGAALLQGVGMTLFVLQPTTGMAYVLLILVWVAFGTNITLTSVMAARYFGRQAFGSIRGLAHFFTLPLLFLGPIYTGWVYDTSGSYLDAFRTMAALSFFVGIIMFLVAPPRPPARTAGTYQVV